MSFLTDFNDTWKLCETVMKKCYNSFIRPFNELKSTGLVYSHIGNIIVSTFCLLLVIYYGFWSKMGQNPYCSIGSAEI